MISASRHQIPCSPVIEALRAELYPVGYGGFREHRGALRSGDLYARPGLVLRCLYAFFLFVEQRHSAAPRRKIVARLCEHIRFELRTTDHTAISPVSGLLSLIALWIHQPDDPELHRALVRFEGWIWEDGRDGTRVAGARSASWDTAFALQALAAVASHASTGDSIARGVSFLTTQQIRRTFPGVEENFRIDPRGGWCFAGVWHGWPVSDCTAEALLALLATPGGERDSEALREGVEFILRCQNADGGFGSYEQSGTRFSLEWLNPAEMFADSMTDRSWVECTSSCISALAAFRQRCPGPLDGRITRALARAARWLAARQRPDGAWPGARGVYLIYG
ncbi:MAG: 2,3-oxidosqualene cyclase, partial [Gammaproteobacteria bacterium]